ncbi:hypothetical protein CEB3_c25870 [Peptococcaceae bacterium CEB3]|nr:hypothetical protein CEB3_c25870 [Peptococcaceae bacterium CEB3]
MKNLIKLNGIAILYAFVLLIEFQAGLNVDRISRITNCDIHTIIVLSGIFQLALFIVSTIAFFFITRKHFNKGKLKFLLMILWIPYYGAFYWIFFRLFPFTNHADLPAPVEGLLMIAILLIYPFYIAFIDAISS